MKEPKTPKEILAIIKSQPKQKISLDVGCGFNKQKDFIGLDKRDVPGVDIVHDAEIFPYPLPKESCKIILCSHLIEHIKPWLQIDLFNELWRLLEVGGQLWISAPYGLSFGFVQDPTHCKPINEATPTYFDPDHPLYDIYKPKPWRIHQNTYQEYGNIEIVLEKRPLDYVSPRAQKGGAK